MFTVAAGATLGAVVPVTNADAGTTATGTTATGAAGATGSPTTKPIPRTLSAVRTAHGGRMHVTETEFPLSHLGVRWRGRAARARLRTAVGWTEWRMLDSCGGAPDGADPVGGNALLVAPGALGYEVTVAGGPAQITELNTVDGPAMTLAAAVASGMPLPDGTTCDVPYLSRAAWGADESLRFSNGVEDWPAEFFPVQTLTVHHTASANNDPNPAATVRAIYYNQTVTKGWGDIGYQLLIDEAGRVYEGRWSGSDPVPVFESPSPDPVLHPGVTGAHIAGFNTGNMGVCLLGTFTDKLPTTAAWDSLVRVLAALARVCRLDPVGTTNYYNPVNNASRTVKTISGHRDWAATECPGNLFYPHLPTVRDQVAALMPPPVIITPAPRRSDGTVTQPAPRR